MEGKAREASVFRWMWRSYARAALLPLVLVEALLVAAYLITNNIIADANIAALQRESEQRLQRLVDDQAAVIDARIATVMQHAEVFRQTAEGALRTPFDPGEAERSRYAITPGGAFYTRSEGDAALLYSSRTRIGDAERRKAWQSAQIDPVMKRIRSASPLVMQAYLNTHDSMNRIHPYFDVLAQYPHDIDIPSYNFYYEADAAHNPTRSVVWTDVYLDPAGQGWMASCIAPVYNGDFLEGVVGLDVTVESFVRAVLDLDIPWEGYALLIDRKGAIMAMPPQAEADLGLRELTTHRYAEAIARQELKPEAFLLGRQPALAELAATMQGSSGRAGVAHIDLDGTRLAAWSHVPATGWTLLAIVPEKNIYADSNSLKSRFQALGLRMILGLVLFYVLFFAYLYWQARRMAALIGVPLREFAHQADDIGRGRYAQEAVESPVAELNTASRQLVAMGGALGAINASLAAARDAADEANRAKSAFLAHMSHELRTPMNAILGYAQLLGLDAEALQEEHRAYVAQIERSGQHLMALLNDVLELSRIESGRIEVAMSDCELAGVLGDARRMIERQAAERRIELLGFDAVPAGVQVRADRLKLLQVLINLLSNAVKYNREGGFVEIDCVPGAVAGRVRVRVRDNGRGITEEQRRRLFVPFERLQRNDTVQGTGIGLIICRHLLEAMDGTIGLEEGSENGACFWIELARAPAA